MCFYEGAKIVVVANLPTGPAIGHGDYRRSHILYECDVSRGHKLQSWWVFKRKRTLFAEATAAVVRATEALYASIQARAGTVPDGNLDEARAEAETFSVAVFCYQKRCGVRYFLSMEMEQEFGLLAHFIVAGALFYMGWSVLEEDLTAAQFLLIYNVLNCAPYR